MGAEAEKKYKQHMAARCSEVYPGEALDQLSGRREADLGWDLDHAKFSSSIGVFYSVKAPITFSRRLGQQIVTFFIL